MERINRILKHELYQEYIQRINVYEQDRIFCGHDMVHFLDVCRLAQIEWLELRLAEMEEKQQSKDKTDAGKDSKLRQINKELIYAAGLLHDIGRWQEYEKGIRHEIASGQLAPQILKDCGFDKTETDEIINAIGNHRNSLVKEEISLSGLLYRADKKSRACFSCKAEKECDWSAEKKNLVLN